MNKKHIDIRIAQCLALAEASGCPRRKIASLLLDPMRNVVLSDGYNGGPRGAEGSLCRGYWCERNGFRREDVEIVDGWRHEYRNFGGSDSVPTVRVRMKDGGHVLKTFDRGPFEDLAAELNPGRSAQSMAEAWVEEMVAKYPPIASGTRMERGCHHSEVNVVCNAAANGIQTQGAWLICLAEPCMMCAKIIHHAGITKVILVDGGYIGGKDGVEYLVENGVLVEEVEGPRDPRFTDPS